MPASVTTMPAASVALRRSAPNAAHVCAPQDGGGAGKYQCGDRGAAHQRGMVAGDDARQRGAQRQVKTTECPQRRLTGNTCHSVARAWCGIAILRPQRAPGAGAGAGPSRAGTRRRPVCTHEHRSSNTNTTLVGAGANCASRLAPSAPTPMPTIGAALLTSAPCTRSMSISAALSALVTRPVARPCSRRARRSARRPNRRPGTARGRRSPGPGQQYHFAPAAVIRQRAEHQQPAQQRHGVGGKHDRQGQRGKSPRLAIEAYSGDGALDAARKPTRMLASSHSEARWLSCRRAGWAGLRAEIRVHDNPIRYKS